ncbi:MAG: hypothetical protein AB7K68_10795 [Bacteriovoracia bacterium]
MTKKFRIFLIFASAIGLMASAQAAERSFLPRVTGLKFPNSAMEGALPVSASALILDKGEKYSGYTDLLPYVLLSPDQEEAGSCLYMTLTGIAEWNLARLHPTLSREPEGPLDLSERHLMNIAGEAEEKNGAANWKTDSVYLLNGARGLFRNADYRFTKGWYKSGADDEAVKAVAGEPGAEYDAGYNWLDERPTGASLVSLPNFHREVLFADPESNQWNTAVMPADIVDRIKAALLEKKSPVQIIYNHFGYWHSNFIVGFDDAKLNDNCRFVRDFLAYMQARPAELRKEAENEADPKEKAQLLAKALRAENAHRRTRAAYEKDGCQGKGVFYVRDSIYPDTEGPVYDYDPSTKGDEGFYSKKIVLLEYEWVRYMGNHAIQILAD